MFHCLCFCTEFILDPYLHHLFVSVFLPFLTFVLQCDFQNLSFSLLLLGASFVSVLSLPIFCYGHGIHQIDPWVQAVTNFYFVVWSFLFVCFCFEIGIITKPSNW